MFPSTPAADAALAVATRFYSPAERAEVLAEYPRRGFGAEFLGCFEDQATRKPDSAAGVLVANNAAGRIGANPLDG